MTRFSERTGWNTAESDLARAHRLRREAGLPIADLTASNPTRCGFTYPASLLDALTDSRALDYDPQPRGLIAAREAVCRYYADHGVALDPDQIVLTTSTSEAYSFLFRLLLDPGGEVLVPQPGYPLFDFLATLDDVRIKAAPLVYDEGWQIDFEGMRRAITPQTRAIVVVHPNNPTGHFTKAWEKEELARICRIHSLSLIVDEVFLDYGMGATTENRVGSERSSVGRETHATAGQETGATKTPRSFAAGIEGVPVYVVSGLSKIAGLPQMKAAWIVATGPKKTQALERLEVIADTFLSMNAPVQWALPAWLGGRAEIQEQIRRRVSANLAELDRQLATQPTLERLAVEGGWYAVLRVPALEPDEHTVLTLLERGVWVHPGYFFGLPESGWLVVSLLGEEAEFRTGLVTVTNYFRTNQQGNF
ncbi:MAG: pyridoxal phosphate-dependent aminotransferase [Terracidiphilus sp.]|nr:pyridoxal phosphate-dependent aminotransferase [Terracidiphilus sp.]MDR3798490.1 pyridoxal phosphate-dependent aminotransferase [Terracidiphilus sp.]